MSDKEPVLKLNNSREEPECEYTQNVTLASCTTLMLVQSNLELTKTNLTKEEEKGK